jgi:hypothetical protein
MDKTQGHGNSSRQAPRTDALGESSLTAVLRATDWPQPNRMVVAWGKPIDSTRKLKYIIETSSIRVDPVPESFDQMRRGVWVIFVHSWDNPRDTRQARGCPRVPMTHPACTPGDPLRSAGVCGGILRWSCLRVLRRERRGFMWAGGRVHRRPIARAAGVALALRIFDRRA